VKIYNYSAETREFLGAGVARESPMEPGVFIFPAYSTEVEPPSTSDYECAIFTGEGWDIVPDYRGVTYYLSWDDEGITITELGISPPKDSFTTKPEKPPATFEDKVQMVDMQRREAYKQRVDPLTNEYQVKILTGESAEAEALIPLIIAEREAIKTEYPWPVEGE
jgi:hypothetical protein